MSFFESVAVAAICIAVVFLVLAVLFALVQALSSVLGSAFRKGKSNTEDASGMQHTAMKTAQDQTAVARDPQIGASVQASSLKLNNVDERTAAMIMAVVSHETGTPLNELAFKSISLMK